MSLLTPPSGHSAPVTSSQGGYSFAPKVLKPHSMAVILMTASCLIISTNLLIAVALTKILVKKKRQSWCFVLNLAVADTLVGVAVTGLATEDFNTDANNNTQSRPSNMAATQGRGRCLLRMTFVTSPCIASIMSMFLISLDRYAAIKMPLRYAQKSGKGVTIGALTALWIAAFALGFMPVMVPSLQSQLYDGFCDFFSVVYDVGIIILYSVCFFPVLSVFVYIYLDILKIACTHQRQIFQFLYLSAAIMGPIPQANQCGCVPCVTVVSLFFLTPSKDIAYGDDLQNLNSRSPYWSHVKALRTVGMLVGCFLVLWCPFFIAGIVKLLCKSCQLTQVLESYLFLLGLSNSLINPLVYAFWQQEVRLMLADMFSCCKPRTLTQRQSGITGSCHQQQGQNITRDTANANKSPS